jgi:GT2 family glycosyltransferase
VLFHRFYPKDVNNNSFSIDDRKEYQHMLESNLKSLNFFDVKFQSNKENDPKLIFKIPDPKPLVSIIIPTKNSYGFLQNCIDSILNKTIYQNFEAIIINNNSNDQQVTHYLSTLDKTDKFLILSYPNQFNYSAINNLGANYANGDVLIFLNNDTEVISETWINELVSHALRPSIGAVGAMLYYPNDNIQHAGIILNNQNIAAHAYVNEPCGYKGQRERTALIQNYSAVTGACLAIEKKKFEEVKGFDDKHLPIAYNDIDLCLKLIKAGYRNLWTPHAELYHQESATREYDTSPSNKVRLEKEAGFMREKWADILANDPAYNPNLSFNYPLFSLSYPPRVDQPWKK